MKRLLRTAALVALAAIFVFCTGAASAQFNASLSGSVLDPTQAVIPGASLTLTNTATQATQTVQSGSGGVYRFSELPPGTYNLKVTASGFQQNLIAGVSIAAETPRNVDVTLQLGKESTTVNVNANTIPLLQTSDASIGATIDGSEIEKLPTFGADPYEQLRTAPGITGDGARQGNANATYLPNGAGPGGSNSGVFQTENQVQISAAGQPVSDNTFLIDGVTVDSLTHGGSAVVTPNEEAVGAITVVATSYDASDGRNSGAQIKVVSKSGTNQLHGSAFFLYDEPGLNAYNKFGGPTPGTPKIRNANKQRTWAGSLGGPIIKDKLFLFASYEEYKQANSSFTSTYVETPQYRASVTGQRAGTPSAIIAGAPGVTPRIISVLTPSCTGINQYNLNATITANACQVVGGGIDVGSLYGTAGAYPPNTIVAGSPVIGGTQYGPTYQQVGDGLDGVPDLENVLVSTPSQSRGNQYNARLDWQITPKDLVAGSVYFTKLDNLGPSGTAGSRPNADVPFKPFNSAETIIYIHTFSPAWLNELRGNATRFADNGIRDSGSTVNYGLPYVNVQGYPFSLQFDPNYASTTPSLFAENTYEIRDQVTHVIGSHSIRAGIEARFEQDNDNLYGEERPMNGLWAFANSTAVYEMVNANPNTGAPGNTQRYFRSQDFAGYVQHDWKATPNLTINTGLRWEIFTPLYNKGFEVNYPRLGPTGQELSGLSLQPNNALYNLQKNNWGPNLGFAYTPPMFNNKIVIRGGYSLKYDHLDIALFNNALEDGPGIANFGLCCGGPAAPGSTPGQIAAAGAGILYAVGSSNSPSSYPANPVLAVGLNSHGFPNSYTFPGTTTSITPSVETYGALKNLKIPSTDLYSLEIQGQFTSTMTATIGYQGASGRHEPRLVDQNFLYNSTNAPAYATYFAQTDSVINYNSLNARLNGTARHGFSYAVVYRYSKAMDQISNGDGANSLGNQTNPANNASEYGPSDYDLKHLVTVTAIYQSPTFHTGHEALNAVVNGWQVNGIYTYHTGFPWTPVTGSLNSNPFTSGAASINPVRPLGVTGVPYGTSCSNSAYTSGSNFTGGGSTYFITTLPNGQFYTPGIGRNSLRGPCYQDVDMSFAKEITHDFGEHHTLIRFQANMYNILNILQLEPLTNGNANGGSNINNQYFGYAQAADEGRVIEFLARIQF
jgi:hypothetical protein